VDVFYPELAPFSEQLDLFTSRPVILGTAGSAFHTAAFLPRPIRTILVNPEPTLNANFRIFDALTGARPAYFHAETEDLPLRPDQAFARNFRFTRPREIAEELLGMI
jgi:capsular polysaccharide biosynthesis protein